MKKEQKKFMIFAIIAVIFSLLTSLAYYKYEDYRKEKELEKFKNIFNVQIDKKNTKNKNLFTRLKEEIFSNNKEKTQKEKSNTQNIHEESNLEELLKNNIKEQYFKQGYILKKDSILKKIKTFFGADKGEELTKKDGSTVEIKCYGAKILVEEKINEESIKLFEYTTEDNFANTRLKIDFKKKDFSRNLDDINSGFGVDTYKDGSRIEFKHVNQIPVGPAVKYYANGDREEFRYKNGQRYGFSTYYFTNGDKEEVYYIDGVLEGKARYIYADGYVEIYKYKNGQRVE